MDPTRYVLVRHGEEIAEGVRVYHVSAAERYMSLDATYFNYTAGAREHATVQTLKVPWWHGESALGELYTVRYAFVSNGVYFRIELRSLVPLLK
jgi:hypothetical protein